MKKLILPVVILMMMMASCTEECPDCKTEAAQFQSERIESASEMAQAAWTQKDKAALMEAITDDFVRTENGEVVATNKAEMDAAMDVFFTAFPDMVLTIPKMHAGGSTLVSEWTAKGTHTGPFGDIPATGNEVTFSGASIITYDDAGLITREEVYYDVLDLMTQLGFSLTPPSEGDSEE